MRNLKRALSLALASVMLLGMMVVGTGASYADVDSADNVEAIEVMQAVGVMSGDDKGNFNPDQKVTRGEMAVIMANLLDLKVEDFVGAVTPFTDVPDWAKAYVAACYADGITAGISATEYGFNYEVTTAQAALMMMKALGYFQMAKDFGSDWQVATVKQGSKIKIFDGISAGASTAMTRNEVAQMALNALEATMVETDGTNTTVTLPGGIVIDSGDTKYVDVTSTSDYAKAFSDKAVEGDKYAVALGEKLFDGDLKKSSGNDDAGRPGTKWTYDKETVGTYGDEADYVVVLDDDYSSENTAAKFLKVLQDLTDNDDLELYTVGDIDDVKLYINGKDKSGQDFTPAAKSGTVVELFCDGDVITQIVGLDYAIAEIEDVSTSLTKAQKEDGATCKIKVDGTYYLDIDVADFNADTYEEGAYILYAVNEETADKDMLASEIADYVEGKVTAKRGSEVRIDGTYYDVAAGTVSVGDEGVFYLNKAGQIEAVDTSSTASGNYAYIYKMDKDTGLNSDGIDATTWTAYVVLADGTKASYEIDVAATEVKQEGDPDPKPVTHYYFDDAKKLEITEEYTGVIAYSINSDDELVYKTAKDDISDETTVTVNEDNAAGTSSSTKFIFAHQDGSSIKVSTATGYKNVDVASAKAWTVTNSDDDIVYVFVGAKNGSVTTDANLAVILDADAIEEENEDGDIVYAYVVAVDGEETELTFEDSQTFKAGEVIAYEMDGDYAVIDEDTDVTTADVASATDDYFTVSSTQYNLGGDEIVYTITMEYEDEAAYNNGTGTPDAVTVSEGGKVEADDDSVIDVAFTLDKGDLDIVFVYEYIY